MSGRFNIVNPLACALFTYFVHYSLIVSIGHYWLICSSSFFSCSLSDLVWKDFEIALRHLFHSMDWTSVNVTLALTRQIKLFWLVLVLFVLLWLVLIMSTSWWYCASAEKEWNWKLILPFRINFERSRNVWKRDA